MAIHRPPQALVLPLSVRMCSLLHRFNTPYTAASKKSGYSKSPTAAIQTIGLVIGNRHYFRLLQSRVH